MKRDVKAQIALVAKQMFNQRGYAEVSMRDIAAALGMSKGNLTYHFKKKEDIAEAVALLMNESFTQPPVPKTLQELDTLFRHIYGHVGENAYFFWHYGQLARIPMKIKRAQAETVQSIFTLFRGGMENLSREGLVQEEQYPGQYDHLLRALIIICMHWTPYLKLEAGARDCGFFDCVWSAIYPVLTDEGRKAYDGFAARDRNLMEAAGR